MADGEPGPPQRLALVVAEGGRREDLRAGLQTEASQPVRERLPPQREEAMLRDGEGEGELRLGRAQPDARGKPGPGPKRTGHGLALAVAVSFLKGTKLSHGSR